MTTPPLPLHIEPTSYGALRRFDAGPCSLLTYPASELEPGLLNLYLRTHRSADRCHTTRLLEPGAGVVVHVSATQVVIQGRSDDWSWRATLDLDVEQDAWRWHVDVRNESSSELVASVAYVHDIALTPYESVRANEYYVSQYLDLTHIDVDDNVSVAVRQNMPGAAQPWAMVATTSGGGEWATDLRQIINQSAPGADDRVSPVRLPNERLQHEHAAAMVATTPQSTQPGQVARFGFVGCAIDDHPAATSDADADIVRACIARAHAPMSPSFESTDRRPNQSLFTSAATFPAATVDPPPSDEVERDASGAWLEVRHPTGAVTVSVDKERAVLRPHGQVLRSGRALTPDTLALTSTIWMRGVFASQLTQGHVRRKPLISGRRGYLPLQRAHGLRGFVDRGRGWELLDLPSTWTIEPDGAAWHYCDPSDDTSIDVTAHMGSDSDTLHVAAETTSGSVRRMMFAMQLAITGDDGQAQGSVTVTHPSTGLTRVGTDATGGVMTVRHASDVTVGGDELLHADERSRDEPWVVLVAEGPTIALDISVAAASTAPSVTATSSAASDSLWDDLRASWSVQSATPSARADDLRDLQHTLSWFAHDAVIHYLSPRGLEQFTGGGWGTRDVCQGPIGLARALGRADVERDILCRVFQGQQDDGGWPQWFEFLPPLGPGPQVAHGDVVYWPLLATGEYLGATGDTSLLDERVAQDTVRDHIERALDHIDAHTVPHRALPAYGHGDWNDSLQPADPRLAARMASTWTSVLKIQALRAVASGLATCTDEQSQRLVERARQSAIATTRDFDTLLLVDDVLAGYGVFDAIGTRDELLVHPSDTRTGLTWGVLPWIHAISAQVLAPDAATRHAQLIRQHLLGPDGARLFDTPPAYRGGPMQVFQRAEASSFWGREIGLMYMHAHLRWAEALAVLGDARALFAALMLAVPAGIQRRVPQARYRQSTCYYSSSDGVFRDRWEAARRYSELIAGDVELEGGWRVYSSGPGLFLRMLVEQFAGVRTHGRDHVDIDPVIDPRLVPLTIRVPTRHGPVTLQITAATRGHGVVDISADGARIDGTATDNPYRPGGLRVLARDIVDRRVVVQLS